MVENVRPVGKALIVEKLTVPTPPDCMKVWLKLTPVIPLLITGLVTVIVGQITVRVYVAPVAVQPFASVAVTLIGNVPVWAGVPARTPLLESESPFGKALLVENVIAPTPPDCVKLWLNATPAAMVLVAGLFTVIVGQLIMSVYVTPDPIQPFESVALTLIGNVPVWVGVPERIPAVESVKPIGNVLAVEKAIVPMPPDCVKAWLKNTPAVPVLLAGLFIKIVGQVFVSKKLTGEAALALAATL